jgi:phospholipid/cholesterol/gamma-HCH transport system substrate-binding protein
MKRLEWKVGLFVLIGLVALAGLLIEFSKSASFFRPTFTILLRAQNAGSLRPRAQVLMSGVQVGTVADITLAPNGKYVTVNLAIYKQYRIYKDARFVIEQSGFLGDQYVAIVPTTNEGPYFSPSGENVAQAEAPFNLQEFTRSASGFITRIDDTIKKLNDSLVEVQRLVLNPETLTNLAMTAANLRTASQQATTTLGRLDVLVATNGPALNFAVTNLVGFSEGMRQFATSLNSLVDTNAPQFNAAVSNLADSAQSLKSLMADVQAGHGLAGEVLKDPQLAHSVSEIMYNLSVTTSNLNRNGLWGILWHHKPPEPREPPPKILESPKAR